ncbi:MAG: SDR family NAD(P)-dependent oxidoreductase [Candidatus Woesearchaeota archaeon]
MAKILVTGGAGFIGSFLVDELIKQGDEVVIYDNLEPQVHNNKIPDYLNPEAEFIKGDVRNYEQLKNVVIDSDIIVNFAARVGVGQSMYQVKEYIDTNELGTANLLHALVNENHNVKKVIVASSMSIYGEGSYYCEKCEKEINNVSRKEDDLKKKKFEPYCPFCNSILKPIPTKETKPLESSSIYAISKKNQEEMTLNIGKAYGIPSVALRFFNTYGPRQSLSNPYTGVAAIFMSRIKNNNPPLIFEDGKQSRDFISVHDIVRACLLSIKNNSANYEVFNVGTGKKITIGEVSETLIELFDSNVKPIINNEYRKGDIRHCFADITKIKNKLDFEPKVDLKEGLQEIIDWSKEVEAKDLVNHAYKELKEKKLV